MKLSAALRALPSAAAFTCGIALPALSQTPPEPPAGQIPTSDVVAHVHCENGKLVRGNWSVAFPNSDRMLPFFVIYPNPDTNVRALLKVTFGDKEQKEFLQKTTGEKSYVVNNVLKIAAKVFIDAEAKCAEADGDINEKANYRPASWRNQNLTLTSSL